MTFSSLHNPNLRLYFAAQIVSGIGAWIQITAENWLVLRLAGSGAALGITNALQFGPLLFLGLYGGVIVDRFDRRRLLIATQSALAVLAAVVGVLVAADAIRLWMIWLAALLLGTILAIDRPALLGFVKDLAGEADLANAVALNNAVTASGRMLGPAIGGVLIATSGLAPGFFINAASFALVVAVLLLLDRTRLHPAARAERGPGQVREGLAFIRGDRVLSATVAVMSVVFVAGYNFQVLVPLFAARALGGSSELFGVAMSCLGLGAVGGSLLIAARVRPGVRMIALCCLLLASVYVWLAVPLGVWFGLAGLFLLGIACGLFNVTVAATLQVRARDEMRGRVMAAYNIGILGSALIGAPLAGMLADSAGVAGAFLAIAAVCGLAGAWAWLHAD